MKKILLTLCLLNYGTSSYCARIKGKKSKEIFNTKTLSLRKGKEIPANLLPALSAFFSNFQEFFEKNDNVFNFPHHTAVEDILENRALIYGLTKDEQKLLIFLKK
jgi:hypothetical protein